MHVAYRLCRQFIVPAVHLPEQPGYRITGALPSGKIHMKQISLLIAFGCIASSTSMAQPKPQHPQSYFAASSSEEYQLYKIFRSNGRFLTFLMASDEQELYNQLKKFGKGEYICVSTDESLVADRRIIVY